MRRDTRARVRREGSSFSCCCIPLFATLCQIILATGSYPLMRDVDSGLEGGEEHAISSDGFFALREQPRKVAVIGAGYIAVELSGMLAAFGSKVHHFVRKATALSKFDEMVQQAVHEESAAIGITVYSHTRPARLRKESNGTLTLEYRQAQTEGAPMQDKIASGFDQVILAIGRKPRTDGLQLEKAGVKINQKGAIEVDDQQVSKPVIRWV